MDTEQGNIMSADVSSWARQYHQYRSVMYDAGANDEDDSISPCAKAEKTSGKKFIPFLSKHLWVNNNQLSDHS